MHAKPNAQGMLLKSLTASILAITLSGCLSSGGSSSKAEEPVPVNPLAISTSEGEVRGITLDGMRVFRGIPYAAAPVDGLRFAPPTPPAERSAPLVLDEKFGDACLQSSTTGAISGSEDCLYLNVYTPENAKDLPVMVWIHGGAFVMGDGGGEYDPTRLVEKDVIVVTLNYRLGNLGFLAHPGLESDGGNFGLMDQQQAMRWVQQNIGNFGGDPANVTLFGESAGGHSVMSHIVSPRAKTENLFQRAIVQSGSYAPFQQPKALAQFNGVQVANTVGCSDPASAASCLRALDPLVILAAQGSQSLPAVDPDSDLLPKSITDALAAGEFNTELDIMIGSNQDEGTLFVALDEISNGLQSLEARGEAAYRQEVADFFTPYQALVPFDEVQIADDYLARFSSKDQPYSLAMSAIWTDFMFACNSYAHASTFAANGLQTWKYWFRDENAPWTLVPPAIPVAPGVSIPLSFPQGATHAGEIPYVLYDADLVRERYTGTDQEIDDLAETMVDYWTSFAKDGNPNPSNGVPAAWNAFAGPLGPIQQLDVSDSGVKSDSAVAAGGFLGYHNCSYWANPPRK